MFTMNTVVPAAADYADVTMVKADDGHFVAIVPARW
jgi:hypothetical protein